MRTSATGCNHLRVSSSGLDVSSEAQTQAPLPRSLPLEDFHRLRELALAKTGIDLAENKRSMLYVRLLRRLRSLEITTFEEYFTQLEKLGGSELGHFVDTVTTNLTYFFREPHHFRHLKEVALPSLAAQKSRQEPLRVWSAGCASGQEIYSVAMTLVDFKRRAPFEYRLLATDIDSTMVTRTSNGIYSKEEMRGLQPAQRERWFTELKSGQFQAEAKLRQMIKSRKHNLFERWPIQNPVDIIFCRNVMIYFNQEHQSKLIENFAKQQAPGAMLYVGHSESLQTGKHWYERVSNTAYRRK